VQEGGGKPPTEYNVGTIVGKKTKSLNIIVYATGFKYTDWYKSPIDEVQQIKDNREIIEKLKNKNVIPKPKPTHPLTPLPLPLHPLLPIPTLKKEKEKRKTKTRLGFLFLGLLG